MLGLSSLGYSEVDLTGITPENYFRVHSACITVTTTFCSTSVASEVASSALLRVSILYHQLARCSGHEAAVVPKCQTQVF